MWQRSLCILKLLSQILFSLSFPVACILIYVNSCFLNRSLVDIKFVFLNIKSNVNLHFNPEYGYNISSTLLVRINFWYWVAWFNLLTNHCRKQDHIPLVWNASTTFSELSTFLPCFIKRRKNILNNRFWKISFQLFWMKNKWVGH